MKDTKHIWVVEVRDNDGSWHSAGYAYASRQEARDQAASEGHYYKTSMKFRVRKYVREEAAR